MTKGSAYGLGAIPEDISRVIVDIGMDAVEGYTILREAIDIANANEGVGKDTAILILERVDTTITIPGFDNSNSGGDFDINLGDIKPSTGDVYIVGGYDGGDDLSGYNDDDDLAYLSTISGEGVDLSDITDLENIHQHCQLGPYRSLDGTCNNLLFPNRGASMQFYRRGREGAEYADNVSLKVTDRPNERSISNVIGAQAQPPLVDPIPHSMMAVMFGQFINHDFEDNVTKNQFVREVDGVSVFLSIPILDADDPACFLGPAGSVFRCGPEDPPINIAYRPSDGEIFQGKFEVYNRATSYLDLDIVYGTDESTANALREFNDGRLLAEEFNGITSFGLPFNFSNLPPSRATTGLVTSTTFLDFPDNEVPTTGDHRSAENIALTMFHTLFLREHNRLAAALAVEHPDWDDERLFQEARRINIAQYQNVVMYEYAPEEFGSIFAGQLGPYKGYQPTVDPTTSMVFATAAFRYGHSSLASYPPIDESGQVSTFAIPPFLPAGSDLPFVGQPGGAFTPMTMAVIAGGYENVIRGLVAKRVAPVDTRYIDQIRNIPAGNDVIDLLALDIQRGRNNGVPNYERVRLAYYPGERSTRRIYRGQDCPPHLRSRDEVDPMACFLRITANDPANPSPAEADLAASLRDLYGKVTRVDAIVGLLAEPPVQGSSFGKTQGSIIIDQYRRARAGDRFWFENNQFDSNDLTTIRGTTMSALLERNFNVDLPESVFLTPGEDTEELTVNNVAPSLGELTVTSVFIDDDDGDNGEGLSITIEGTFTDPGNFDLHNGTATWSDGFSGGFEDIALGARSLTITRFLSEEQLENNFPEIGDDTVRIGVDISLFDDALGTDTTTFEFNVSTDD